MNYKNIKQKMIYFLQEEVKKIGFQKVVIGISGGLDSAIVSSLCREAFGRKNTLGILMPSNLSNKINQKDAIEFCKVFDISYETINISKITQGYFKNNLISSKDFLRFGNFCARIRMSILYDISAKKSALVIGTSNKSEILLGYGTIYGDTACAINPIGELYKSDAFDFAKFLKITKNIIQKPPSADLWKGQSDEQDLGYSYFEIDKVLKKIVDKNYSQKKLIKSNKYDEKLINMLFTRIKANKFKNKLPIVANLK